MQQCLGIEREAFLLDAVQCDLENVGKDLGTRVEGRRVGPTSLVSGAIGAPGSVEETNR